MPVRICRSTGAPFLSASALTLRSILFEPLLPMASLPDLHFTRTREHSRFLAKSSLASRKSISTPSGYSVVRLTAKPTTMLHGSSSFDTALLPSTSILGRSLFFIPEHISASLSPSEPPRIHGRIRTSFQVSVPRQEGLRLDSQRPNESTQVA